MIIVVKRAATRLRSPPVATIWRALFRQIWEIQPQFSIVSDGFYDDLLVSGSMGIVFILTHTPDELSESEKLFENQENFCQICSDHGRGC